jgi:hypothetical protein
MDGSFMDRFWIVLFVGPIHRSDPSLMRKAAILWSGSSDVFDLRRQTGHSEQAVALERTKKSKLTL